MSPEIGQRCVLGFDVFLFSAGNLCGFVFFFWFERVKSRNSWCGYVWLFFEWRLKFECVGDLEGFIVNFFAGIYSICKFLF